jgi:hypothetical protein
LPIACSARSCLTLIDLYDSLGAKGMSRGIVVWNHALGENPLLDLLSLQAGHHRVQEGNLLFLTSPRPLKAFLTWLWYCSSDCNSISLASPLKDLNSTGSVGQGLRLSILISGPPSVASSSRCKDINVLANLVQGFEGSASSTAFDTDTSECGRKTRQQIHLTRSVLSNAIESI